MSTLENAHYSEPLSLDANRGDVIGLALSTLVPLVLVLGVSVLVTAAGMDRAYDNWLATVVFFMLFPMWGAARWLAWQKGDAGQAASHWVAVLIGWGLAYPFLAALLDPFWLGWTNLLSVLLTVAAAVRLAPVSKSALLLVLPTLLWVTLAAIPGYLLLTGGWSPGFAVTVAVPDSEQ